MINELSPIYRQRMCNPSILSSLIPLQQEINNHIWDDRDTRHTCTNPRATQAFLDHTIELYEVFKAGFRPPFSTNDILYFRIKDTCKIWISSYIVESRSTGLKGTLAFSRCH